jgi:hypothetical protein
MNAKGGDILRLRQKLADELLPLNVVSSSGRCFQS